MPGIFIVVEGVDGVGKSTLVKNLADRFRKNGKQVHEMHFPNRETPSGQRINAYLKEKQKNLDPKTLQELFVQNRKEAQSTIRTLLRDSKNVIVCDRYSLSGVAYAVGAEGMDLQECLDKEAKFVMPTRILFLDADPAHPTIMDRQRSRAKKGEQECYDKVQLQIAIHKTFHQLFRVAYQKQVIILDALEPKDVVLQNAWEALHSSLSQFWKWNGVLTLGVLCFIPIVAFMFQ